MCDKPYAIVDQPSTFEFFEQFPDEDSAREYFMEMRWPSGQPVCPHCQHTKVYTIRGGKILTCKGCRKQFTVRIGTVMEGSKIPLLKWLYAMYLVNIGRKGISSIQLAKELGITQKSAWFLSHRLRASFEQKTTIEGVVQADEAYIGGKETNKHASKKLRKGRGAVGKTPVVGVRNKEGETRAQVLKSASGHEIRRAINESVTAGAELHTDEHAAYKGLTNFRIESVSHSKGEYVRNGISTNSVESLWAVLKRGHYGTFHQWSVKHLQRYVDEFTFRMNTRGLVSFPTKRKPSYGLTAFELMIAGMEGKRLTYKTLIA